MSDTPTPPPPPPPPVLQFDPKRRLRELLAIPERDRSDEQWDEIVELEIQTAPGNRSTPGSHPSPVMGSPGKPPGQAKKHHRSKPGNNNRRPPKPKSPPVV